MPLKLIFETKYIDMISVKKIQVLEIEQKKKTIKTKTRQEEEKEEDEDAVIAPLIFMLSKADYSKTSASR